MKGKKNAKKNVKQSKDMKQDKEIKTLKKKVNIINRSIEDKYINSSVTGTALAVSLPYTTCLNTLSQGTSLTSRLGNETHFKMLRMKLYFYNTVNTFSNDNIFRILLIREKPQLGSAISLNSLFGSATPNTWSLFENTNRDFKNRFFILHDSTHNLWDNRNFLQKQITINKKLNFNTNYARGNAGTVADIDTNGLHLVVISAKVATTIKYFSYEYELTFEDA